MKKLLFLSLVSLGLLSSCSSVKVVPNEAVYYIDYSRLEERGLFVTESNSVSFNYKSVGNICVELREGKNPDKTVSTATIDETLDLLYKSAMEKGANGIIDLKIVKLNKKQVKSSKFTSDVYLGDGYMITGMAIKK